MKIEKDTCQCGCLDTATGEWKKGVADKNGVITKFVNPLPWYKKMFGMKQKFNVWGTPEFFGTCREINHELDYNILVSVYRERHIHTGEMRYYTRGQFGRSLIDGNAVEKMGKIVYL